MVIEAAGRTVSPSSPTVGSPPRPPTASARDLARLTSSLGARWDAMSLADRDAAILRILEAAAELRSPGQPSRTAETSRAIVDAARFSLLTARELDVLGALASGGSTESIARSLGISAATVRSHVKNILGKLGARSRLEAISMYAGRRDPGRDPAPSAQARP
jgi:DNA-binding NarL/FixJ family response regulator